MPTLPAGTSGEAGLVGTPPIEIFLVGPPIEPWARAEPAVANALADSRIASFRA
ncbi:MAG: hypothetical protein WCB02_11000 [Bradyrhizobium sp.]